MQKNNCHSSIVALLGIIFFVLPIFVYAQEFTNFAAQAILGRDGTLGVEEHFTFDFGTIGGHGVLRELPLLYGGKNPLQISFHMISAADKDGVPYKHDATGGGNIALMRVGDKDIIQKGSHYYDLRYTLSGLASDHALRWQITTPVKEMMKKFQADVYFTMPVPPITATGTCEYIPNRTNRNCSLQSLIKEGKLYGFRVSAENVSREGIIMEISYPKGLISPPVIEAHEAPKQFPKYIWPSLVILVFFGLLSFVLWKKRDAIARWREERKKPVVIPDTYSYLARAMSSAGYIAPKDVIATVVDLTARGYVTLSPIAHPVGEFEFIDYALLASSVNLPEGSEGKLLEIIIASSGISSLDTWLHSTYAEHRAEIEEAARNEVIGVVLLQSDEKLPDLPGFKSERFI